MIVSAKRAITGDFMPIHDWTRVAAGIFHDFHHEWISTIKHSLNRGLLPPDHYAMAEQIAGSYGPDVLTLEGPNEDSAGETEYSGGGIALAKVQPKVSFRARSEADIYAEKANRIAIRHVSDHRVVAVIEIVSPGNKAAAGPLRTFVEKAAELLRAGIHLMIIDPFPPTRADPQGLQHLIWDEFDASDFAAESPADHRLLHRRHRKRNLHRAGRRRRGAARHAADPIAAYLRPSPAGIHIRISMGSGARDFGGRRA